MPFNSLDQPPNIASPTTVEELAALLRHANQHHLPVTPIGGGTKQTWGNPVASALHLDTSRLNQVKEHIWQDMTCTVEAGTPWSTMQAILEQHGQYVALDPLWPASATVGGIIATNDSGALRLKYGSLRDLVIGMTVVLADGTIAKTGGKVVKNVAGYDLHKLMTGAFGTLGVIAEVTFRLHAVPTNIHTVTIASPHPDPLGGLLLEISGSQLSLHALQLRTGAGAAHLDVSLATMDAVLPRQMRTLEQMAVGLGLAVEQSNEDVWQAREQQFTQHALTLKATMLPTAIAAIATRITQLGGTTVTQAGGIMTASLPATSAGQVAPLRQHIESTGGHLTLLCQPTPSTLPIWGTPPDTLPLMRTLKHHFDPNRILNPGRFLDGI